MWIQYFVNNSYLNNEEFCNISLLKFNGISSESITPINTFQYSQLDSVIFKY